MVLDPFSDEKIIDSWHKNAQPWTVAVRQGQIESRKWVTDAAIARSIIHQRSKNPRSTPTSVLDLGCGEGWLTRELTQSGFHAIGVDAVPALIDQAKAAGAGEFRVMSYEAIASLGQQASEPALLPRFDIVVCNFSLLGEAAVEGIFRAMPVLLNPAGCLVVQTLHPAIACGDLPYEDGWRAGDWVGFSEDFIDPAPWYFRTLESWIRLFIQSNLRLCELYEPLHPQTQKPASIIFVATHVKR